MAGLCAGAVQGRKVDGRASVPDSVFLVNGRLGFFLLALRARTTAMVVFLVRGPRLEGQFLSSY